MSVHPYFLEFQRPFTLAHGVRKGTQLALVRIEHDGVTAFGEASLPPYLKETFASVKTWVDSQVEFVPDLLRSATSLKESIIPFSSENPAASAALQSALFHWRSMYSGKPLSELFPENETYPQLCLTVTKDDLGHMEEKLILAEDFTHLKLKLTGGEDDLDFLRAIRDCTELPFCVDVNQGFKSKEEAARFIDKLGDEGVILVEQPLKDDDHEGHHWLKQRVSLPIIADESIRQFDDLVQFHEAYSGVNVKLMKCGGLLQAQQMLHWKGGGEKGSFFKLLGCMSESSLGVGTAAVLSSQASLADLDAPYLCKNDPFKGFSIKKGRITLNPRIEWNGAALL